MANIIIAPEVKAAHADKYYSSSKYGKKDYCTTQGSNNWWYRTFLQYDLSAFPVGTQILSAKLWIYCYYYNDNASKATHNFSRVLEDWSEPDLTWNNQPSVSTDREFQENLPAPNLNAWTSYDLTSLVQSWVNEEYPNYGVQIVNNNEGSYRYNWQIRNRRYSDGSYATYLEIEYLSDIERKQKYLLISGGTIYTVTDGALSALEQTELTAQVFADYGTEEIPGSDLLITLTDPEICAWSGYIEDGVAVPTPEGMPEPEAAALHAVQTAVPSPQTLVTPDYDMTHYTILGIEKVLVEATDGVIFAVSFDSGETWKTYTGEAWGVLSEYNTGMTASIMQSITAEQWAEVATTGKYRFRITLSTGNDAFTSIIVDYINEEAENA